MKKLLLIPTLLATTTPVMVLSSCGAKHINIDEKLGENCFNSKYFNIKKSKTYTFHVDLTKFDCEPGDWSFSLRTIDPISGEDVHFGKYEIVEIKMGKYTLKKYSDESFDNDRTYQWIYEQITCRCYEKVDTADVTIKSNKSTDNVIAIWQDT